MVIFVIPGAISNQSSSYSLQTTGGNYNQNHPAVLASTPDSLLSLNSEWVKPAEFTDGISDVGHAFVV